MGLQDIYLYLQICHEHQIFKSHRSWSRWGGTPWLHMKCRQKRQEISLASETSWASDIRPGVARVFIWAELRRASSLCLLSRGLSGKLKDECCLIVVAFESVTMFVCRAEDGPTCIILHALPHHSRKSRLIWLLNMDVKVPDAILISDQQCVYVQRMLHFSLVSDVRDGCRSLWWTKHFHELSWTSPNICVTTWLRRRRRAERERRADLKTPLKLLKTALARLTEWNRNKHSQHTPRNDTIETKQNYINQPMNELLMKSATTSLQKSIHFKFMSWSALKQC